MIAIEINHDWCNVTWECDPAEWIALQDACSYTVADRWMSPAYQAGFWDGRKCLLKKSRGKMGGKFPTGIFSYAIDRLKGLPGQRVDVTDSRVYFDLPTELVDQNLTFSLRDYQREGGNLALQKRRGVLRLPTGSGKTKTMVAILNTLNLPTLWITHEGALARQSIKQIEEGIFPKPDIGTYFGGSQKKIKRWTVGLVQSLHRNRESLKWWFDQIKVVVLDECHHAKAETWYEVVQSIPAPYRFGCSATPFERADKSVLELHGVTGPVVYEKDPEEVKEFLSRPKVEMIHHPRGRPIVAFQWEDVLRFGVVQNEWRNGTIIERAMRSVIEGSTCLIFVSRVEHGHILYDELTKEIGVDGLHEFISGKTPQDVRDECYSKLRSGDLRVLIASDKVAGEGQDVPSVHRVIIGGGLKAAVLVKQRVGRGMRPSGEGTEGWGGEVLIHDFVDYQHPKLLMHSDQRRGHYASISSTFEETRYAG